MASVAAFVRRAGSVSYGSTKSWMAIFTEGIYLELKSIQSNVKIQALCPGFTYSEFHDTLKVERKSMAGPSFWLQADDVVKESLKALPKGKLFVVPGWRYKAIVGLLFGAARASTSSMEAAGCKEEIGRKIARGIKQRSSTLRRVASRRLLLRRPFQHGHRKQQHALQTRGRGLWPNTIPEECGRRRLRRPRPSITRARQARAECWHRSNPGEGRCAGQDDGRLRAMRRGAGSRQADSRRGGRRFWRLRTKDCRGSRIAEFATSCCNARQHLQPRDAMRLRGGRSCSGSVERKSTVACALSGIEFTLMPPANGAEIQRRARVVGQAACLQRRRAQRRAPQWGSACPHQ